MKPSNISRGGTVDAIHQRNRRESPYYTDSEGTISYKVRVLVRRLTSLVMEKVDIMAVDTYGR